MSATILPRTSETVLDTGMHYKIRNNTDSRLTTGDGKTDLLRWDKIAYRCEPGMEVIVPWPVIALYFGDPRSQHGKMVEAQDSRGMHQVPTRGNELLRLSVFYGTYEHNIDILAAVIPDVTILTLDNVEIIPPCFDPEGEYIYGFQRSMQKSQDVATLIESMQEQIDALRAGQAARNQYGDNDGEIPRDDPPDGTMVPV
jgi:hypothetical protein